MAHGKHDRVQETTTNAGGTGALTLAGASAGFRAFGSVKSNGDTFYGLITYGSPVTQWEISLCTYNSGGGTISRGTVVSSSTGATVDFSGSGPKTITDIAPASKTLTLDSNNDSLGQARDFSTTRRVGAGVASPLVAIHGVGASSAVTGTGTEGVAQFTTGTGASSDEKLQFGIVDGAYAWIQASKPGTTQRELVINPSGGNVGIGTTNPNATLHVNGDVSLESVGRKYYFSFSGGIPDTNWQFGQVNAPFGARYATNSAVVIDVYGGGANYGFMVRSGSLGAALLEIQGDNGHVTPGNDNTQNLGSATYRFAVVYAGTGTINTSDAGEKDYIRCFTPQETAVAVALAGKITLGQWKDALAKKGAAARVHAWLTAQDVRDTFLAHSLEPFSYGCVGFDELEKVEHYTETVKRPKMRKVSVAEKVVEIIDGKPVMVIRNTERDEPVGAWDIVTDQATGAPVIVMVPRDTGQRDEQGQTIIVEEPQPLRHFVREYEEVEEPRTRVVPDLDENGERRIRMNVRPDQLAMWLAHGFHHRLAAIEAALAP